MTNLDALVARADVALTTQELRPSQQDVYPLIRDLRNALVRMNANNSAIYMKIKEWRDESANAERNFDKRKMYESASACEGEKRAYNDVLVLLEKPYTGLEQIIESAKQVTKDIPPWMLEQKENNK